MAFHTVKSLSSRGLCGSRFQSFVMGCQASFTVMSVCCVSAKSLEIFSANDRAIYGDLSHEGLIVFGNDDQVLPSDVNLHSHLLKRAKFVFVIFANHLWIQRPPPQTIKPNENYGCFPKVKHNFQSLTCTIQRTCQNKWKRPKKQ